MASKFRLWLTGEEHLDIEAERFEVESGGVLVFYEEQDVPEAQMLGEMESEERPFAAYSEWNSVIEK